MALTPFLFVLPLNSVSALCYGTLQVIAWGVISSIVVQTDIVINMFSDKSGMRHDQIDAGLSTAGHCECQEE